MQYKYVLTYDFTYIFYFKMFMQVFFLDGFDVSSVCDVYVGGKVIG